jgi:Domain of unknown function (DUF4157)
MPEMAHPIPAPRQQRATPDGVRVPGQPLEPALAHRFGNAFGHDFSRVRVHADASAARSADELDALAYTFGTHIAFGAGQYRPSTMTGQRLIAHELAHVVQQERGAAGHTRDPEADADRAACAALAGQTGIALGGAPLAVARQPRPATPNPPTFPTIPQVLTDDGKAFRPEYPRLQEAYDHYRRTAPAPASPERWIRLARGSNRALLLGTLGPNLGAEIEPSTPNEADILRLGDLQRPADYPPEQLRQDLEFLSQHPEQLQARLGGIPSPELARGEISVGYLNIAAGNVGELLAEPARQLRLRQLRARYPTAEILRGVRAQLVVGKNGDGTPKLGPPQLFTDDPIAVVGANLQLLWIPEVKAGGRGGAEATEQIHTWIEKHLEDGFVVALQDGRTYRYAPGDPGPGVVVGLARAPRSIVAARGTGQGGAAGAMGTAAAVERIELRQTAAQLRYLAGLTLQSLAVRAHLRELQANTRTAYEADSVAVFTEPEVVQRILTDHGGLATASGRLYRLRDVGGQLSITEVPVVSLAFVFPSGTAPRPTRPSLPPGPAPSPRLPRGQAPPQPLPPGPAPPQLPAGGAPGAAGEAPEPLPVPVLRPAAEIERGAVPATSIASRVPYITDLGTSEFVIVDAIVRDSQGRPIRGYQDGDIWIRVIRPGGVPLPEIDPATGAPAPARPIMTPEGPARAQMTPYEPPAAKPATGAKAAVSGAVIIVVINDILTPLAATRNDQQQNILRTQAQIRFLAEFGAEPRWEMEDVASGKALDWRTKPELGWAWGNKRPRIVSINAAALRTRLPERIRDFQSLVLFLQAGKLISAIDQRGAQYFVTSGVGAVEITDVIERIRSETLRGVDARMRAERAKGGDVFKLRSSDVPIYRYSSGISIRTSPYFLGSSSWVRPTGVTYRSFFGVTDRVQVEPANAEAAQAALNAWYLVKDNIDDVYSEVTKAGRTVTSREPRDPRERLISFTADPLPPELGATRYVRHYQLPNSRTIAIGELRQFWVNRADLEPVAAGDVAAYATGPPTAPPPSRYFLDPVIPEPEP